METGLSPGESQKQSQAQRKFVVGEVDSCMSVGASIIVADVRVGGVLRGSSNVSQGAKLDMFERQERTASVGVTPLIAPLLAILRDYAPKKEALSYSADCDVIITIVPISVVPRTRIQINLSYVDPQSRALNYCLK